MSESTPRTPVRVGLLVRLEAKPEHAEELGDRLSGALALAEAEEGTTVWFVLRFGPTSFGIFDAFPDDDARRAHIDGRIAELLYAHGPRLLAARGEVHPVEVLAAKLAG